VLVRGQRRLSFLTRDAGFYVPEWRHRRYCLIVMHVGQDEVATLVRRNITAAKGSSQAGIATTKCTVMTME
jgi:hypothetical protein